MTRISVRVDGVTYEDDVEPRLLLVHYLRERVGKTGTPVGCDTSNCGACTVHLDGVSVKSCSVLAVQADGRAVETVEGLAREGVLHPIQQAFIREDAFQCGFCTPGQIMVLRGLLRRNAHPSLEDVRRALDGNVCRCGAHLRVQAAALAVARAAEGAGGS